MPVNTLNTGLSLPVILIIGLLVPSMARAQAYVDPRQSMSGYAAWCESQGGRVDTSSGVACVGASGSPSSGYGGGYTGDFQTDMAIMAIEAFTPVLQNLVSCLFDPSCGTGPSPAQRAAQQRELQRQHQEAERIRREKERQQRIEFENARNRIFEQMRDTGGGALPDVQPRSLLRVEEKPGSGSFNNDVLVPRNLTETMTTPIEDAGKRVFCTEFLMTRAGQAAANYMLADAAFLGRQAELVANGKPASVSCPDSQLDVGPAGPIAGSVDVAEQLKLHSRVVSRLFSRANEQAQQLDSLKREVVELNQQVNNKQVAVDEAKTRVEFLRNNIAHGDANASQLTTSDPEPSKQTELDDLDALLNEALAALEASENMLAESQDLLAGKREALNDLSNEINQTQELAMQLQNDKNSAGQILEQLDPDTDLDE